MTAQAHSASYYNMSHFSLTLGCVLVAPSYQSIISASSKKQLVSAKLKISSCQWEENTDFFR